MKTPVLGKFYKTLSGAIAFMESMRPKRLEVLEIENGYIVVSEEIYKKMQKEDTEIIILEK